MAVLCAAVAAALASAAGGETITLAPRQECGPVTVARAYPKRVTLRLTGSRVAGLAFAPGSGNVRVVGGEIVAPAGRAGAGATGYAVLVRRASRVTLDGVTLRDSKYGAVIDAATDVTITRALFTGLRADGIQAVRAERLTVTRSRFEGAVPDLTRCHTPSGMFPGLSQRACLARDPSALWQDGTHTDAIQMRGVADALIADNVFRGQQAGVVDFRGVNDPASRRIRVLRNDMAVQGFNGLALVDALDSEATANRVMRAPGSTRKAVLRLGAGVRACGNEAQDGGPGREPCAPTN